MKKISRLLVSFLVGSAVVGGFSGEALAVTGNNKSQGRQVSGNQKREIPQGIKQISSENMIKFPEEFDAKGNFSKTKLTKKISVSIGGQDVDISNKSATVLFELVGQSKGGGVLSAGAWEKLPKNVQDAIIAAVESEKSKKQDNVVVPTSSMYSSVTGLYNGGWNVLSTAASGMRSYATSASSVAGSVISKLGAGYNALKGPEQDGIWDSVALPREEWEEKVMASAFSGGKLHLQYTGSQLFDMMEEEKFNQYVQKHDDLKKSALSEKRELFDEETKTKLRRILKDDEWKQYSEIEESIDAKKKEQELKLRIVDSALNGGKLHVEMNGSTLKELMSDDQWNAYRNSHKDTIKEALEGKRLFTPEETKSMRSVLTVHEMSKYQKHESDILEKALRDGKLPVQLLDKKLSGTVAREYLKEKMGDKKFEQYNEVGLLRLEEQNKFKAKDRKKLGDSYVDHGGLKLEEEQAQLVFHTDRKQFLVDKALKEGKVPVWVNEESLKNMMSPREWRLFELRNPSLEDPTILQVIAPIEKFFDKQGYSREYKLAFAEYWKENYPHVFNSGYFTSLSKDEQELGDRLREFGLSSQAGEILDSDREKLKKFAEAIDQEHHLGGVAPLVRFMRDRDFGRDLDKDEIAFLKYVRDIEYNTYRVTNEEMLAEKMSKALKEDFEILRDEFQLVQAKRVEDREAQQRVATRRKNERIKGWVDPISFQELRKSRKAQLIQDVIDGKSLLSQKAIENLKKGMTEDEKSQFESKQQERLRVQDQELQRREYLEKAQKVVGFKPGTSDDYKIAFMEYIHKSGVNLSDDASKILEFESAVEGQAIISSEQAKKAEAKAAKDKAWQDKKDKVSSVASGVVNFITKPAQIAGNKLSEVIFGDLGKIPFSTEEEAMLESEREKVALQDRNLEVTRLIRRIFDAERGVEYRVAFVEYVKTQLADVSENYRDTKKLQEFFSNLSEEDLKKTFEEFNATEGAQNILAREKQVAEEAQLKAQSQKSILEQAKDTVVKTKDAAIEIAKSAGNYVPTFVTEGYKGLHQDIIGFSYPITSVYAEDTKLCLTAIEIGGQTTSMSQESWREFGEYMQLEVLSGGQISTESTSITNEQKRNIEKLGSLENFFAPTDSAEYKSAFVKYAEGQEQKSSVPADFWSKMSVKEMNSLLNKFEKAAISRKIKREQVGVRLIVKGLSESEFKGLLGAFLQKKNPPQQPKIEIEDDVEFDFSKFFYDSETEEKQDEPKPKPKGETKTIEQEFHAAFEQFSAGEQICKFLERSGEKGKGVSYDVLYGQLQAKYIDHPEISKLLEEKKIILDEYRASVRKSVLEQIRQASDLTSLDKLIDYHDEVIYQAIRQKKLSLTPKQEEDSAMNKSNDFLTEEQRRAADQRQSEAVKKESERKEAEAKKKLAQEQFKKDQEEADKNKRLLAELPFTQSVIQSEEEVKKKESTAAVVASATQQVIEFPVISFGDSLGSSPISSDGGFANSFDSGSSFGNSGFSETPEPTSEPFSFSGSSDTGAEIGTKATEINSSEVSKRIESFSGISAEPQHVSEAQENVSNKDSAVNNGDSFGDKASFKAETKIGSESGDTHSINKSAPSAQATSATSRDASVQQPQGAGGKSAIVEERKESTAAASTQVNSNGKRSRDESEANTTTTDSNGKKAKVGSKSGEKGKSSGSDEEIQMPKTGLWAKVSMARGHQEADGKKVAMNMSQKAITGGFDFTFAENVVLGVAFGHNASIIRPEVGDSKVEIDGNLISLYSAVRLHDRLLLSGQVGYASLKGINDKNAKDRELSSKSASASLKYSIHIGNGIMLSPKVGIDFTKLSSGIDSKIDDKTFSGNVGASLSKKFKLTDGGLFITPEIHGGISLGLNDKAREEDMALAKLVSHNPDRGMKHVVGGAVKLEHTDKLEFDVGYDYTGWKKYGAHQGYMQVKLKF
jgi:hypothetical protein